MIPRKQSKYKEFASASPHIIDIERKSGCVSDGLGGFVESWIKQATNVFCFLAPYFSDQIYTYKSTHVECTHVVKIRGYVDVIEKDRIVYGTRIFEVMTVEDLQERKYITEIYCKELR